MKIIGFLQLMILFLVSSFSSFGQDYRDTLNAAREAYNKGNYQQALKYYKSAERLGPKELDLSQEKGQSAYKAGDFETAKECFDKLASGSKSTKTRSKFHTDSGLSSLKKEDYGSAVESCKEALRNDPSNENARQILVEAKRLKKQQEEKEKQNNDQNQGQGEDQNEGGGQDDDQKNNQGKPSKSQNNKNNKSSDGQPQEATLEDRHTERKLDELSKQDLDAKRRMNGTTGSKRGKGSKNDW